MNHLLGRPDVLRRAALTSLIANVVIVVTGGAVRLTGSGLGCPTWPRCTEDSYVTTPAMGIYGAIEFGNRLLTFAVGLAALAVLVSALYQRPRRPRVVKLSALVLAGIPAQAIVGGFTVLTDLNPWVVGCHFLVSIAVIAAAYLCWRASREGDGVPTAAVPRSLRQLALAIVIVTAAVLVVGVMVTGSGPHAGDADAKRNGLAGETVAQVHADLVFLLLGLAIAAWFAMSAVHALEVRSRVAWLLAVSLAQGAIGFVQYFTHLPVVLVGAHMLGSCLVWIAALAVWSSTRKRPPVDGIARMVELAKSQPPVKAPR